MRSSSLYVLEMSGEAESSEAKKEVVDEIQFAHVRDWQEYTEEDSKAEDRQESLTGFVRTIEEAMRHKFRCDPDPHYVSQFKMPFHVLMSRVLNKLPKDDLGKYTQECKRYLKNMANAVYVEYRFGLIVGKAKELYPNDGEMDPERREDKRCLISVSSSVSRDTSDARKALVQYMVRLENANRPDDSYRRPGTTNSQWRRCTMTTGEAQALWSSKKRRFT